MPSEKRSISNRAIIRLKTRQTSLRSVRKHRPKNCARLTHAPQLIEHPAARGTNNALYHRPRIWQGEANQLLSAPSTRSSSSRSYAGNDRHWQELTLSRSPQTVSTGISGSSTDSTPLRPRRHRTPTAYRALFLLRRRHLGRSGQPPSSCSRKHAGSSSRRKLHWRSP